MSLPIFIRKRIKPYTKIITTGLLGMFIFSPFFAWLIINHYGITNYFIVGAGITGSGFILKALLWEIFGIIKYDEVENE